MAIRSMVVATAVIAAGVPLAASASSFDYNGREVRTEVVRAWDLDLSTGWGMDKLIKRLRSRIDAMCDWDMDCRNEAWLSADWQVARALSRDQWRRRIAMERAADRRDYRLRRQGPPPGPGGERRVYRFQLEGQPGPSEFAPAPPVAAPARVAGPPPGAVPVGKEVTTTTRTYTVKTTTVRVIYRLPVVDGGAWTPRCRCAK